MAATADGCVVVVVTGATVVIVLAGTLGLDVVAFMDGSNTKITKEKDIREIKFAERILSEFRTPYLSVKRQFLLPA